MTFTHNITIQPSTQPYKRFFLKKYKKHFLYKIYLNLHPILGRIGLADPNPSYKLHVKNGKINHFLYNWFLWLQPKLKVYTSGNIGIGTIAPNAVLVISASSSTPVWAKLNISETK